jgi:hypothetical protein
MMMLDFWTKHFGPLKAHDVAETYEAAMSHFTAGSFRVCGRQQQVLNLTWRSLQQLFTPC